MSMLRIEFSYLKNRKSILECEIDVKIFFLEDLTKYQLRLPYAYVSYILLLENFKALDRLLGWI